MPSDGDLNSVSEAIGALRATVAGLAEQHRDKGIKDEAFRRAVYEALPVIKETAEIVEKHDARLEKLEAMRNRIIGGALAVSAAGSAAGAKLVALFTGNGSGH